jgi:hypothetical protein
MSPLSLLIAISALVCAVSTAIGQHNAEIVGRL